MTNQQELREIKKTRTLVLTKYSFAHLDFKMSRIQLLLEDLDSIWKEQYVKWLAEEQRSSLVRDKYHEKV